MKYTYLQFPIAEVSVAYILDNWLGIEKLSDLDDLIDRPFFAVSGDYAAKAQISYNISSGYKLSYKAGRVISMAKQSAPEIEIEKCGEVTLKPCDDVRLLVGTPNFGTNDPRWQDKALGKQMFIDTIQKIFFHVNSIYFGEIYDDTCFEISHKPPESEIVVPNWKPGFR